jgi:hypothetical protein
MFASMLVERFRKIEQTVFGKISIIGIYIDHFSRIEM